LIVCDNQTYRMWKRDRGLCGTRVGRGKVRRGAGREYSSFNRCCFDIGRGLLTLSPLLGGGVVFVVSAILETILSQVHLGFWRMKVLARRSQAIFQTKKLFLLHCSDTVVVFSREN
jgi:hypothetical protein